MLSFLPRIHCKHDAEASRGTQASCPDSPSEKWSPKLCPKDTAFPQDLLRDFSASWPLCPEAGHKLCSESGLVFYDLGGNGYTAKEIEGTG